MTAELRNDQAACDRRDRVLADEWHRLTAAMRGGEPATSGEVGALRQAAAAAVEWRAQFHGPGRGPRETALFTAVDALTNIDPYADVRPPDGECYCGGCVGMGPCDDDLSRAVEDDDGWFLDHDDWNDDEEPVVTTTDGGILVLAECGHWWVEHRPAGLTINPDLPHVCASGTLNSSGDGKGCGERCS